MRIEEESRIFYFSRNNNLNYKNCTIDYISFSYFRAEKFIFIFVPAFRVKLFQSFHWRKKSKSYPVFPLLSLFKKKSANTAVNVTRNVSNLQLKSNTAWTLFKKKKSKNREWKQAQVAIVFTSTIQQFVKPGRLHEHFERN